MWGVLLALAGADPGQAVDPTVDVAGGVGFFSPLRRPWELGPTLDGQVDVTNLVKSAPSLGASAGVQAGFWPAYGCSGGPCPTQGVWRLGVGPTWATRFVDASVFLRMVGFGKTVDARPAVQATLKVDGPGNTQVRPFLGVEGVRFIDLNAGVRLSTRVREGSGTRARQCEEGDTRVLSEPEQQVSYRWVGSLVPEWIEFDYGDAYISDELKNPLGEMKTLLGDTLAVTGAAQSAANLGKGTAGVGDYAGRMQDLGGKFGLNWTVPLSPADLPGALASNYLEIGRRAIDALIPKLEAHRTQFLFGANISYEHHTAEYVCVPVEVCTDGWWTAGGWQPKAGPSVSSRRFTAYLSAPDARTPQGRILALWRKIGIWYRSKHPENFHTFQNAENICVIGNGFDSEVQVDDGASRQDCEQWLSEQASLQSERRALVGSSMELFHEQLEWSSEQAQLDCEEARETVEFESKSARTWAEIARISGSASSQALADETAQRAEESQAHAERQCDRSKQVDERLGQSQAALEGAPGRIEAIDTRLEELEDEIKECDLLSPE